MEAAVVNSFCQTSGRCDKKISAEQLEDVGVFAWSVSLRSRRGSLMQQLISFFGLTAVVVILSGPAHCQGVGASGDIKGMVTDANHATVPKVKILVVATQTGLQRSLLTDDAGEFWVTDLAPTTYDVSAEFQGFETAIQKNVTVTIGQTVIVDFQLSVSSVTARLRVTWEPPLVDTERASHANVVEERYIRNLPIDRRDYPTYASLSPLT